MKIKGTCTRCGREFLVQQVVDNHGHCPWCGQPFSADYTAILADVLQSAETAGSVLEDALERIEGMDLAMELDEGSILGELQESLGSIKRGARKSRT
jgi:hypothetical protein